MEEARTGSREGEGEGGGTNYGLVGFDIHIIPGTIVVHN
jgi:hypothetical protein